jgi:hypothetical protein
MVRLTYLGNHFIFPELDGSDEGTRQAIRDEARFQRRGGPMQRIFEAEEYMAFPCFDSASGGIDNNILETFAVDARIDGGLSPSHRFREPVVITACAQDRSMSL